MVLANGASAPVRPTAETPAEMEGFFDRALDAALAGLDRMMGPRQRAAAIASARREIFTAAEALVKAERRKTVAELTPVQLRREIQQLLDSHTQLLDYLDDLDRQPVIAAEVRRLRRSGQLPWPL
jgi:hypothetical protein